MIGKGKTYDILKEYTKSIDCYDKISRIDPKNTTALNYKGSVCINLKEY